MFDQERISEQLEGQRQEQALQRYHSEAEELDHWLLSTRATLSSALKPVNEDLDMEEQLIDCQVRFAGHARAWSTEIEYRGMSLSFCLPVP